MSEKKGFCTLLSDQIIDERKAVNLYEELLTFFEEEKKLLTHDIPESARPVTEEIARKAMEEVRDDEESHELILKRLWKGLCKVKKE